MRNRDTSGDKPLKGLRKGRRVYRPPEFIRFGSVRDLTATGSGRHPENTGADEENNKRRFP